MARKAYDISKATASNWDRLNTGVRGRLTHGANKSLSVRRVIPSSYLNAQAAALLLDLVDTLSGSVTAIMRQLCEGQLRYHGLWGKPHVQQVVSGFPKADPIEINLPTEIWESGEDVLGFVYQALLTEGERNASGKYYTTREVAGTMLADLRVGPGQRFLDPCCGSGTFLLLASTEDPTRLYGMDQDPIAVMLAQTNLLTRFADQEFMPNIICADYLTDGSHFGQKNDQTTFDYIYTNPPWGTDRKKQYKIEGIRSHERSSLFFARSLSLMKASGQMHFLLPKSLLTTRGHQDLRRLILQHTTIHSIDLYDHRFDGVFTGFFSIRVSCSPCPVQSYLVSDYAGTFRRSLTAEEFQGNKIPFGKTNETERSILQKMEDRRHDSLTRSRWALGIVTGRNKKSILRRQTPFSEPIYKGRHITPFQIGESNFFVQFQPDRFQQCAHEELYRAPEKLIYRFIARYPIVAYDDRQRLCLNSANILIPQLDGIPVRCVASLLNSTLYRFYYTRHFPDIKVLKSNLQRLPFPLLSDEQRSKLSALTDEILSSGLTPERQYLLDQFVFTLFGLDEKEQAYILQHT